VASARFIGAVLLIAVNALGETTSPDRSVDVRTGMTYPGAGSAPQGSFGWALVGTALIGSASSSSSSSAVNTPRRLRLRESP
jgi:hypothetical protein